MRESTELQGVNSLNCFSKYERFEQEKKVFKLRSLGMVNKLYDVGENVAIGSMLQYYKNLYNLRLGKLDSPCSRAPSPGFFYPDLSFFVTSYF